MGKAKKNIDGIKLSRPMPRQSQRDSGWLFRFTSMIGGGIMMIKSKLASWKKTKSEPNKVILDDGERKATSVFLKKNYVTIVVAMLVIGLFSLMTYNLWGVKNRIVEAAENGVDSMKSGVEEIKKENFGEAAEDFAAANLAFVDIKRELGRLGQDNNFLAGSIAEDEYKNITLTMDGMIAVSRGAKLLSLGLKEVADYSNGDFSGLLVGILTNKEGSENILPVVDKASDYFAKSAQELENGVGLFSQVDENRVPQAYKKWFDLLKQDAPRYMSLLQGMDSFFQNLDQLLGREMPVSYLMLFQNYNEIRPTGGFIGSYGLVNFQDGKMTKLFFDDIYNPDGQMLEKITPPYPISMMTTRWEMRDSNWNPDFPTSAVNAVRMYEKEGGFTVDGVVAFTPEVVSRFLTLTGPVEMKNYGTTLDENNFTTEIQKEIELEYDPVENKPKKILADLLPILMERLANLSEEQKESFWQTMLDLLTEKHIMVYSFNPKIEQLITDVGWGGEMKEVDNRSDYLSIVHSNIGGRKSDLYIKEAVRQSTTVAENGDCVVEVEITRKNTEDWTWPNYSNYDYVRVYVPEGSELLSVDGFVNPEGMVIQDGVIGYDKTTGEVGLGNTKVYVENGKTVFANWMVTDPWSASTAKYTYKLPFKINDNYSLYYQKQSGRREIDYLFKFVPGGSRKVTKINKDIVNNQGEYFWRDDGKKDLSILFDLAKN